MSVFNSDIKNNMVSNIQDNLFDEDNNRQNL